MESSDPTSATMAATTVQANRDFQYSLFGLPNEVFLSICSYLDVPQMISLSETCRAGYQLTKDRTIWLHVLRSYQQSLPLPKLLRTSESLVQLNLSAEDLKSIVLSAHQTAQAWYQPKSTQLIQSNRYRSEGTVVGLELILDRWLLSVHHDGLVHVWDVLAKPPGHTEPVLLLNLKSRGWGSYVAAFDEETHSIVLTLTASYGLIFTRVYRIYLPKSRISPPGPIEQISSFETPVQHVLKSIDIARHLVIFSRSSLIDIISWDDPKAGMISVSTNRDLEGLFDGLVAFRIAGPYIVAFRIRSIDIYPLPLRETDPQRLLYKQTFSLNTFRDILLSDIETTSLPDAEPFDSILKFSFLAYDVLQGLFRYEIRMRATSNYSVSPIVDLTLVGVYPMAHSINALTPPTVAHRARACPLTSTSPNTSPSREAPTPTPLQINFGNALTGVSARGFVSTFCLGPQGRRAVWVERSRGSTTRDFIVWGAPLYPSDENCTIEMERSIVHTIGSYDLRDDVTSCALGEISGRIAFANRAGDIFLLSKEGLGETLDQLNYPRQEARGESDP